MDELAFPHVTYCALVTALHATASSGTSKLTLLHIIHSAIVAAWTARPLAREALAFAGQVAGQQAHARR